MADAACQDAGSSILPPLRILGHVSWSDCQFAVRTLAGGRLGSGYRLVIYSGSTRSTYSLSADKTCQFRLEPVDLHGVGVKPPVRRVVRQTLFRSAISCPSPIPACWQNGRRSGYRFQPDIPSRYSRYEPSIFAFSHSSVISSTQGAR